MATYFVNIAPCLIGMEACGSANHWARKLEEFGHTVKLIAPQFVKPYVKTNKNDAADAEAICEAVDCHAHKKTRYAGLFSDNNYIVYTAGVSGVASGWGNNAFMLKRIRPLSSSSSTLTLTI